MFVTTLKILAILLAALAGLYALHRLALWMERKGWIYYRTRGDGSAAGNALMEIQSIFEPASRHGVEVRKRQEHREEEEGSGAPPDPEGR